MPFKSLQRKPLPLQYLRETATLSSPSVGAPVAGSKVQACQGQTTCHLRSSLRHSGPPRCGHSLSSARITPLTLAIHSGLPPALNSLASPRAAIAPLAADPDQFTHRALIFAAVGLPGAIGLPGGNPGRFLVGKIAGFFLNSSRKDVVRPGARGFLVEGCCRALMSFVAHAAEHTLSTSCLAHASARSDGRHHTPNPTSDPTTGRTLVPFLCPGGT